MPRSRKAPQPSPSSSEAEEPARAEAESETELDEPAPTTTKNGSGSRSRAKRRASASFASNGDGDYSVPLNDDSNASASARPSIRKSNSGFIEVDDRAEKLKRRKSARVSFAGQLGDDETVENGPAAGNDSQGDVSGRDLNRSAGSRPSMRTARLSHGGSLRINAVAPAPAPAISMDVMNSNFEEWMKMATDNKINAANSWNFALIDYFHDMSLLRNTDDNTINFQKASLTLDGCVKIWTTRVDSVGTETGKLLSNLAQNNGREQDDDDDENGEEDGGEGEGGEGTKKKQKVHRTEATLVKSYAQLQVKKLDLDFAVDPLFRKTRAEFDEGGATGLLLNHLGVDSRMRVVFDSGDSKITDDDEEEEEDPHQTIDVDHLRNNLLPPLDTLDDRTIAQDLAEFRFSSDPSNLDFTFMNKTRVDDELNDTFMRANDAEGRPDFDDDDAGGAFDDFGGGGGDVEDFFTGDQAPGDNLPQGGPAGFMPFGADGDDSAEAGHVGVPGGVEPFDPRRAPNERDLVMAMNVNDDQEEMLDYFDATFMKNWAGPEHWKLRRAVKKPEAASSDGPKAKKEKTVFTIAFLDPPEQTAKQLFVPATKSSMITLPAKTGAVTSGTAAGSKGSKNSRTKKVVKRDDHLLPDDMHFTSQQLLRLFLKPKFTLKMRRYGMASGQLNDLGDGEVDQHFWAQANQMGGDELDHTQGGGPIPFNTQFFHDDFDDGTGFDDDMDMDAAGLPMIPQVLDEEGDLLAATQGPLKRVRPEFVNYARKAKRVDVRKLKENIWRGLKIITPQEAEPEANPEDVPEDRLTDPKEAKTFNSVINGLRSTYSRDKMEEISTSFCFICLLHLANERGLKIEVGGDTIIPDDDEGVEDEDAAEERRRVGDIWSLNVYRDPTATASA